ncbi:MAG: helix-turn-helix transcriptional regulator [Candidatus Latescibacteria bacterium]|jgi:putative transcriptional regulator|nr:helix-turn-helix transcriptional regulator [Desulfobacteraceae bacterium]MBT4484765.1 helix-turn-helix transcriptional regulator [Candidatus Latescibacterota bacterium]
MSIIVNLDVMMARRKMSLNELAKRVNITLSNLSILKTGKARAVRFTTLDAICVALDCQPGDILEFRDDENSVLVTSETKDSVTLGVKNDVF